VPFHSGDAPLFVRRRELGVTSFSTRGGGRYRELSKEKPSSAVAIAFRLLQHIPRHTPSSSIPLLHQTFESRCSSLRPCSYIVHIPNGSQYSQKTGGQQPKRWRRLVRRRAARSSRGCRRRRRVSRQSYHQFRGRVRDRTGAGAAQVEKVSKAKKVQQAKLASQKG
jgi:hypothetical protein